jgi:hypothetical protein
VELISDTKKTTTGPGFTIDHILIIFIVRSGCDDAIGLGTDLGDFLFNFLVHETLEGAHMQNKNQDHGKAESDAQVGKGGLEETTTKNTSDYSTKQKDNNPYS